MEGYWQGSEDEWDARQGVWRMGNQGDGRIGGIEMRKKKEIKEAKMAEIQGAGKILNMFKTCYLI
jgi:hypothetical protein